MNNFEFLNNSYDSKNNESIKSMEGGGINDMNDMM